MREVDYLIVGQGIAGSIMAYRLLQANKRVCVIDKGHEGSASFVAAGVINPLVLKRLTLSWRAEEFLDSAHRFYPQFDKFLSINSFHPIELSKLIISKDEEKFWESRWHKVPLKGITQLELEDTTNDQFKEKFKSGIVEGTAWVDLKLLLKSFRGHLMNSNSLIEESFEHQEVDCHQYKDIRFDKIIFCEGSKCLENPFFSHLPFSPNKGELITLRCPSLRLTKIYKKKVFVLPLGDDLYRVGATYERTFNKDYSPEEKQKELIEQFKSIFNCDFELIEQESGVRPAVRDRRPLMGQHPLISNFYLFNGLGSRGCLMAPKLSEELIEFIEEGNPISSEVDLNRVNRDN